MAAEFVLRAKDSKESGLKAACVEARRLASEGHDVSLKVSKGRRKKTDRQHRTLWGWHREVAAQLNQHGGACQRWGAEDVHELIFKPRFMPAKELEGPGGELYWRARGLSDSDLSRDQLSEAMERYVSWAYQSGFELTMDEYVPA